jgi:hypothetical protein
MSPASIRTRFRNLPVIDEWCCGYVKGIALDPEGWQPLIDTRPDWFEVIRLYGTKDGWERLKDLVETHEDRIARHQAFVDRIGPPCGQFNFLTLRGGLIRALLPTKSASGRSPQKSRRPHQSREPSPS